MICWQLHSDKRIVAPTAAIITHQGSGQRGSAPGKPRVEKPSELNWLLSAERVGPSRHVPTLIGSRICRDPNQSYLDFSAR